MKISYLVKRFFFQLKKKGIYNTLIKVADYLKNKNKINLKLNVMDLNIQMFQLHLFTKKIFLNADVI